MDMTQMNLATRGHETAPAPRQAPERTMTPAVDIAETSDGITLQADMPGVSKDNLSIEVHGNLLTVQGTVSLGESARLGDVYAEVGVARYKRSFELSRDLDADRIEARIAHGVLTLHIPKHEQAKPRRIAVKAS
jgi:HSP20 family molecular chaperone IbpA